MYYVAIPSYDRAESLLAKTLNTLKDIPSNRIYIFVANESQYKIYKEVIHGYNIVIGKLGITNQRKFIKKYFKEGQCVVSIDDDVEEVNKLNGDTLNKLHNLDLFFKESFKRLKEVNLYIWGIYPVRNPFFMKHTITTDLKFIIGTLYGFIVRHDKDLEPICKEKEDYEQSILYYLKDGGVLRYNNVTIKTKFKAKGGLGLIDNRYKANKEAALYLSKTYPQFVSIFMRKEMYEIRLRKTAKLTI
jgi:hypothetical protein